MAKSQYRSDMAIMHEILSTTADGGIEGVKVSRISTKANLSHYAVIDRCQALMDANLLEVKITHKNKIFILTQRGMVFLQEMHRFYDIVNSLNLKC